MHLVNFPSKVALARLVDSLKGVSSHRMHQEFPDLIRHYYRTNRLWSASHFAGSVGGATRRGGALARILVASGVERGAGESPAPCSASVAG